MEMMRRVERRARRGEDHESEVEPASAARSLRELPDQQLATSRRSPAAARPRVSLIIDR